MDFMKKILNGSDGTFRLGLLGAHPTVIVDTKNRKVKFIEGLAKFQEFQIDTIDNVTYETKGLAKYTVNIFSSGTLAYSMKAQGINQKNFDDCISYINSLKNNKSNNNSDSKNNIPEQIKKLSELKDQGILTEEEFNKKKKELLDKM